MSMELMVKAMKAKLGSPIKKLVLIKLADNANDKGECWPSYQHIADHCEVDKRTVMRHVKSLENSGYVRITHRKGVKGNSSNIFTLVIPSDIVSPPSVTMSPPSDRVSLPLSDPMSPRTSHSLEPVNEPVNESNDFDLFWDMYGKKVGLEKCKAKFSKLTKTEIAELLKSLPAYISSTPDKQYRKNPITWINGKCWNDEIILQNNQAKSTHSFETQNYTSGKF